MFDHDGSDDGHFFNDLFQKDDVIDDDNNGHTAIRDDHLHNVSESLLDDHDLFPNGILADFDKDFDYCNIDEIMTDCHGFNEESVEQYFPNDIVKTEYFEEMEEKPDFSKIQNERIDHKKKKVTAVKPIKREIEEIKNGFFKPCYPYSCLISLALKNCSNGQLSVADIYSFVCENFPFFEYANPGWKNSIRHNLSLNKCFLKIDQDKGGSRKSCLWQFNPEKLEKVEQELLKYDERDVKRALRNADDYLSILKGEKGMPQVVRRAKTPEFGPENNNNPPKIMKQVVDYLSEASASQKTKQTVRQVAEQALNQLLMVKSDAPRPRILKPVATKKANTPRTPKRPIKSYESPQSSSSSSESSNSIKKEIIFSPEEMELQQPQYVEVMHQNDEPFDEIFEFLDFDQAPSTSTAMTLEDNVPEPSTFSGSFSLNGNPFRSCRFDRSTNTIRPFKRSLNSNLRQIGQIKDGRFISTSRVEDYPSKMLRLDSFSLLAETKENFLL